MLQSSCFNTIASLRFYLTLLTPGITMMTSSTLLQPIFQAQRELMQKIGEKEAKLGYFCPRVPLDLAHRPDQDWFRLMTSFFIEELGESITARGTPSFHEELIDALHFITELAILANVSPHDITLPTNLAENTLKLNGDWAPKVVNVLEDAMLTVNMLKAKPWKVEFKAPHPGKFRDSVIDTYQSFLELMRCSGINLNNLHSLYFKKNEVNHQRVKGGY